MIQDTGPYNRYNSDLSRGSFEKASLILGVLSLATVCTGIVPIPLGALGILFGFLARTKDRPLTKGQAAGMIMSGLGLLLGAAFTAYSIYLFMTDPEVMENVKQMYERYGIEMPSYFDYFSNGGSL